MSAFNMRELEDKYLVFLYRLYAGKIKKEIKDISEIVIEKYEYDSSELDTANAKLQYDHIFKSIYHINKAFIKETVMHKISKRIFG
jgi:hypothetical protein